MSFSIRLTVEEKALAESYAKIHAKIQAVSVGEAFKRALFERIEDEYVKNGSKSRPISELWGELDL